MRIELTTGGLRMWRIVYQGVILCSNLNLCISRKKAVLCVEYQREPMVFVPPISKLLAEYILCEWPSTVRPELARRNGHDTLCQL